MGVGPSFVDLVVSKGNLRPSSHLHRILDATHYARMAELVVRYAHARGACATHISAGKQCPSAAWTACRRGDGGPSREPFAAQGCLFDGGSANGNAFCSEVLPAATDGLPARGLTCMAACLLRRQPC